MSWIRGGGLSTRKHIIMLQPTFSCVNLFRQINSTNRQADGVGRKKWTQNVRITQQPVLDQRQPRTAWVLTGSLDMASSTGTYSTAQQPTVRTGVSSDRSCAAVTRTSGYIYGPMQKYQVCYGIHRRNRTFFHQNSVTLELYVCHRNSVTLELYFFHRNSVMLELYLFHRNLLMLELHVFHWNSVTLGLFVLLSKWPNLSFLKWHSISIIRFRGA